MSRQKLLRFAPLLFLTPLLAIAQECRMSKTNCALISEKYPFVFIAVTAEVHSQSQTVGEGRLVTPDDSKTQNDGSHERRATIGYDCGTPLFPMTKFPARLEKPHVLKISVRQLGSDKHHEVTCKF
jgi:hypothetical protein